MNPLLSDPWIASQIDQALAPYAGLVSDEQLAWMRAQIAETLAEDEGAARMLHRAHPRAVDGSGEVVKAGAAEPGTSRTGRARGDEG